MNTVQKLIATGMEAAEASMRQALGFAVFSAVVAAVIQVLADRGTTKAIAKFTK